MVVGGGAEGAGAGGSVLVRASSWDVIKAMNRDAFPPFDLVTAVSLTTSAEEGLESRAPKAAKNLSGPGSTAGAEAVLWSSSKKSFLTGPSTAAVAGTLSSARDGPFFPPS